MEAQTTTLSLDQFLQSIRIPTHRHKKGGLYAEIGRWDAEDNAPAGSVLELRVNILDKPLRCTVTDTFRRGEAVVVYLHLSTRSLYARPAWLFDQPDRFYPLTDNEKDFFVGTL